MLNSWYVLDDTYVYDKVNRDDLTIETREIFTQELLKTTPISLKLIAFAVDLMEIVIDFAWESPGAINKRYKVGKENVSLSWEIEDIVRIYFSTKINNLQFLRDVCLIACDLLEVRYEDCLELNYWRLELPN